jgi:hypothetical protein
MHTSWLLKKDPDQARWLIGLRIFYVQVLPVMHVSWRKSCQGLYILMPLSNSKIQNPTKNPIKLILLSEMLAVRCGMQKYEPLPRSAHGRHSLSWKKGEERNRWAHFSTPLNNRYF